MEWDISVRGNWRWMKLEKRNFNNQWNKAKIIMKRERDPFVFLWASGHKGLICSFGKGHQTINSLKVELWVDNHLDAIVLNYW